MEVIERAVLHAEHPEGVDRAEELCRGDAVGVVAGLGARATGAALATGARASRRAVGASGRRSMRARRAVAGRDCSGARRPRSTRVRIVAVAATDRHRRGDSADGLERDSTRDGLLVHERLRFAEQGYAFGNTSTDADAYENVQLLTHRIFYQFEDTAYGGRRIDAYACCPS